MKNKFYFVPSFIVLISFIVILSGCKKEEENQLPSCNITSPQNEVSITQGITVAITLEAEDPDGNISEVKFYIDGVVKSSASSFPYNYNWNTTNETKGSHNIKTTVKDNKGAIAETEIIINIIVPGVPGAGLTDIDGNTYSSIIIGQKEWMVENLKTTKYNDGTDILNITDDHEWRDLHTPAYCWYNNDGPTNKDVYGALYNWNAVNSGKLCPNGWHVPSEAEWKQLEMDLGMSQGEAYDSGNRGTNEGSRLAGNAALWNNGALENNIEFGTSGFTALPGGCRNDGYGAFRYAGEKGYWWSATKSTVPDYTYDAYSRALFYTSAGVTRRYSSDKANGFSVRCVKD